MRLSRNNVGVARAGRRSVAFGVFGRGAADLIGIVGPHGRALAIEVKSARGELSLDQQRFQRMWCAFGGLYVLARSVDDVTAALPPLAP